MNQMKGVRVKVHGLVQGVFFRQRTLEKAMELGIRGFVINCPDGTVEIEAEGNDQALDEFVAWCQYGPPKAKVSHIDINEQGLKNYSSFTIMR